MTLVRTDRVWWDFGFRRSSLQDSRKKQKILKRHSYLLHQTLRVWYAPSSGFEDNLIFLSMHTLQKLICDFIEGNFGEDQKGFHKRGSHDQGDFCKSLLEATAENAHKFMKFDLFMDTPFVDTPFGPAGKFRGNFAFFFGSH